jgi:hypothetical protein
MPPQPGGGKLTAFAPWADSVSKAVAALAIALYATGYLIVSLHHSTYGFVGTNPFRPRILAAGAWFCFFLAIPVAVALRYKGHTWPTLARIPIFLWLGSALLSNSLSYALFQISDSASLIGFPWWIGLGGLVVWILSLVGEKFHLLPPYADAVVSVLFSVVVVTLLFRELLAKHLFGPGAVTLWFFGVTLATIYGLKMWVAELADPIEWSKPLPIVFIALLVFAQTYYSHLRASWGGGAPVDVTIRFTKDSAIRPGRAVFAQLIDEADEGF